MMNLYVMVDLEWKWRGMNGRVFVKEVGKIFVKVKRKWCVFLIMIMVMC
jgi:hypothetical protein